MSWLRRHETWVLEAVAYVVMVVLFARVSHWDTKPAMFATSILTVCWCALLDFTYNTRKTRRQIHLVREIGGVKQSLSIAPGPGVDRLVIRLEQDGWTRRT